MALARNLRTLIVLGTVASLMVTGAIWAHQAVAQDSPECPPDWPNQQYAGPLREKDHGRIQYQDYHTDSDGERWFVIRASDSNGYTTIRAYPASDDADSPDQVCYLIVRKPGAQTDAAVPDQVVFPREREPQRTVESISSVIPTLAPTPTPQVVPDSPPELSSLELDGEVINSRDIVRSGLSRGQEVQIILRISDADGGLAYLALVAQDGTVLDRVDRENGGAQEHTLASTVIAPSTYSTTLRFRAVAVDDAGGETEVAAFSLTTGARPRSPTTSSRPVPRPPTAVSEQHTAGAEAVVEHPDGVQVQIPEAATAGTPSDEHSWTPGSEITEEPDDDNDRMVTVSIQAIDPPEGNVLEGGQVYNISFTDDDGDDVHLRQPVTLTLPYTLPDDKTASDVVVLHWDQRVRRWESVNEGVVDEAAQTISVELQDFSPVRVSFYMTPLEFLSTAMLSFVGADLFQAQYDDGLKHTASMRGEVQFPLPLIKFLGAKIGSTLIIDLDDILSLVNESKQYTVEGEEGFFTYGLNLHLAITEPDKKVSTALKFPVLDVGRPAGSRYNHDVTFEGSISALSIGVEGLDLSLLTLNENGNIEPVAAQLETCMACILNLVYDPNAIDIEAGATTINVAKGEFNTNFEEVLDNLQDECSESKCEITFSEYIGLYLEWFTGGPLATAITAYQAGQSIGLLHQYTSYEDIRPDLGASIGLGYSNGIEKTTGGHDVNGDGKADLVFPPEPGGTPLQIWTTGDNLEDRRYFLELYELTEGWDIQVDTAKWHADLNPAVMEASEDALLRVDFEMRALSTNETHWLVTTLADAPNLGHASFRLVHERALLEGGTDVLVDDVDLPLVKDKPFSDLSAQATVTPDRVGRGETLTYTVSLENRGPDPAENIELHLRSPVQHALLLTSASSSAGGPPSCQESDHFRGQICTLSNLADDESADVSLDFELRETLPHGETLRMSFVVVSDTEELAPGDNSAAADTTIRASDRGALVALYNATSGAGWSNNDNWLTDEPLGEWHGVNTDANGRVIELYLANNQLIGPIPAELGHLTSLRWLNLSQNQLTGELPAEWAGMTELEWLYLWDNQLTGSAPSWLGDLSSLARLELSENGFTGAIPGNLGSLPRLELLMLNDNDLTGTIPVSLGSGTNLRWLSLARNQLLGQIPSALGNLQNLQYLYLSGNSFTGCLPIGLQNVMDNDFDVLVSAGVAVCVEEGDLTPFALNPAKGFLLDANNAPVGSWSDGTTMWVADWDDGKIYAYDLASKARDASKDFNTLDAAGNNDPGGIWSDGTTMWVADDFNNKIYAYDLASKARDASKDFDTLDAAGNNLPSGIWSDGTTMWVADFTDGKLYAYDLASKARDASKDFDTLAAGNNLPSGIWSDGTTMWVAGWLDGKLYAYDLASKARDASKDFDTLDVVGNNSPLGIWSDGTTMWVADLSDGKLYAYDLASKARDASKDFDTQAAAGNNYPFGIWSDGTTMWVADWLDGKLYAYDPASKARDASKDFDTLDAAGNDQPQGIWSDGTTMWVVDRFDYKLYAYDLASKARDASKDFDTLDAAGNNYPTDIWSDGTTMWVADRTSVKLYAYDLASKARDASKDFDTLADAGNDSPWGIWSDGITMWVADLSDGKLYAYDLASKARDASKDFDTLADAGNDSPLGIWSDGTTMWVADSNHNKIYAYNMPTPTFTGIQSDRAALTALYHATAGPNWIDDTNWLTEEDFTEWAGVTTDAGGRVIGLHLRRNGLTGEIPEELGQLTNLTQLSLSSNALTGEIPEELGQLTNLEFLSLSSSGLTGEIPEELGQLTNLTSLSLRSNALTGEIPEELGQLTNLTHLLLSGNALTGEIPEELGQLTNLTSLSLSSNALTGEIPEELGQLTNLTSLSLSSSGLTGEIPEELGQLTNLTYLDLSGNFSGNGLTGEIPEELGQLTNLTHLLLSGNALTGEIPEELGQLTNLTSLSLRSNALTGEIPEELGQLTNLTHLWLASNGLTGEIPEELGQLTNLTGLNLGFNELTGEIPEELGQLTNLTYLNLEQNGLTGEIPEEFGNLANLGTLWLFLNDFTGCIPTGLRYVEDTRLGLPFCDETGSAPVITSNYSFTVPEGTTAVGTLTATDQDTAGNLLVWTLDGDLAGSGPDREHFTITVAGQLAFAAAKDYENPDDVDNDGIYLVVVRVSDGTYFDDNIIKVTLTDVTD